MEYSARVFFVIANLVITSGQIIPEHLEITHGQGFQIRLEPIQPTKFISCLLARKGNVYSFVPGNSSDPFETDDGETILPFEPEKETECGVRILNTCSHSIGEWTLQGTPVSEGLVTRGTTIVTLKNGQEVTRNALEYTLDRPERRITTSGAGKMVLRCAVGFKLKMCTSRNTVTDESIAVTPGLLTHQYSAYRTNFERGTCELEFLAPIRRSQWGLWKITAREKNGHENQICKFNVYTTEFLDEITEFRNFTIRTLDSRTTIKCCDRVPYELVECYLIKADEIEFYTNGDDLRQGNCQFYVPPGNWTCGFNGPEAEMPHIRRYFNVVQYESRLIAEKQVSPIDNITTIGAQHIYNEPLRTCMFLSPSTQLYVLPSADSVHNFTSFRENMKRGHCVISLTPQTEERGSWKVIVRTTESNTELTANIII